MHLKFCRRKTLAECLYGATRPLQVLLCLRRMVMQQQMSQVSPCVLRVDPAFSAHPSILAETGSGHRKACVRAVHIDIHEREAEQPRAALRPQHGSCLLGCSVSLRSSSLTERRAWRCLLALLR